MTPLFCDIFSPPPLQWRVHSLGNPVKNCTPVGFDCGKRKLPRPAFFCLMFILYDVESRMLLVTLEVFLATFSNSNSSAAVNETDLRPRPTGHGSMSARDASL